MSFFLVFPVALALAMDAFAVTAGISLSLKRMRRAQILRLAFHFGLFQFLMPIIGWLAGQTISRYIQAVDHWVAFGLLLAVGAKMIYESFGNNNTALEEVKDRTKGISLLLLSVATSIDALAVGLSFAALQVTILFPAAVIGLVAFVVTVAAAIAGPFLGRVFGKRAELFGGLVLILISVRIVIEHL